MHAEMTEQRLTFNKVAQLYDAVRPGYPSLLYDDLILFSKVTSKATVLDIGCGTGKSTEPLAKRGFNIYALDLGDKMLKMCMKNLAKYKNIKYINSSFESWSSNGLVFDLIISGTAFHWVSESAYQRLVELLKPNGFIGIFWHTYLKEQNSYNDQFDEIYRKHAPDLYLDDVQLSLELSDKKREEQILSIEGVGSWRVIRYYEHVSYDSKDYINLLRTWSSHTTLSESFFEAVGFAIEESGGEIIIPIRTTLCLGKRNIE